MAAKTSNHAALPLVDDAERQSGSSFSAIISTLWKNGLLFQPSPPAYLWSHLPRILNSCPLPPSASCTPGSMDGKPAYGCSRHYWPHPHL